MDIVDDHGFRTFGQDGCREDRGSFWGQRSATGPPPESPANPVGVALTPLVEIGKYNLGPMLVGVTGLPEGPEDLRFPFGGLIGADFFFEHHGVIDVGNKVLYFR